VGAVSAHADPPGIDMAIEMIHLLQDAMPSLRKRVWLDTRQPPHSQAKNPVESFLRIVDWIRKEHSFALQI